jgi:hypothetical protein
MHVKIVQTQNITIISVELLQEHRKKSANNSFLRDIDVLQSLFPTESHLAKGLDLK